MLLSRPTWRLGYLESKTNDQGLLKTIIKVLSNRRIGLLTLFVLLYILGLFTMYFIHNDSGK